MKNKKILFILLFLFFIFPFSYGGELRGVWIATVENIDWPSKQGLSAEEQKAELAAMLDSLKEMGFNTIFLQVRPTADTLWPSNLEPWSQWLSGEQGKYPGYDPLAFAVYEAHKRDMKIHAWFNPFRVGKAKLTKTHPARQHKDWVIKYGDKKYFDPGNPAARAHNINVIMEVVEKYDIDGVHIDDYFYPYPIEKKDKNIPFKDKKSFKRYAAKGQPLDDWRRQNINTFIRDLKTKIKAAKPGLPFGISPFGIWRNKEDDTAGSDTTAFSSYSGIYADSRLWVKEGLVDYIVPQIYWHFEHEKAPYGKVLDWWQGEIACLDNAPQLYIGLAAYKHGTPQWADKYEISRQVAYAREKPEVGGFVYFSASKVLADNNGIYGLICDIHRPFNPADLF
ncbi:uncharacterized lipoprotein YddW (UPF0748 family) [Elusimicrobium simillimum]|uniref:glycoside hydrolase family 10 protein n=1 Tax=Elusimicrobium simillimum TaxID=3143438 RepID=UPI003C6FF44B